MKILKALPKYKKTWVKEISNKGFSNDSYAVYLVAEDSDPLNHHGEYITRRLTQWPNFLYPAEGMYFFELFKYIIKYQKYIEEVSTYRRAKNLPIITDRDIKIAIKNHLLKKHSRKLIDNKLDLLKDYSKIVDHCFNNFFKCRSTKISLVIQKKIGYKYYENIIYT